MAIIEIIFATSDFQVLLYQVFLPFLIIFAILFGILSGMKIFTKKIDLILAIAVSLLIANTQYFAVFANYISQLGGLLAILLFIGVFGFGAIMWAIGGGRVAYDANASPAIKIRKMEKEINKIDNEIDKAIARGDRNRVEALSEIREKYEKNIKILQREMMRR